MDDVSISTQEFRETLLALQRPGESALQTVDRMQQALHELQVHRVELETQNQALHDTQTELEHSLMRYSDLYDHLPLGYVTLTTEGQIVQANLAAAELLQCERERLAGLYLRTYLDAHETGRFAGHLDGCVRSGRSATLEVTLRLKGGQAVAVQLTSRLGPQVPATPRHVLVGIADISKLKQSHRMLEEINREQEAFNYSISHDLRTPLVTIAKYASIVREDHAAALGPEGTGIVERIEAAAQRMEATLKNLLEYSKLAREEIVLEPVNLGETVKELLLEYRALVQETNAAIVVEGPLPRVRGCRATLSQALANLLTNALKYTVPGEQPRVTFSAVERDGRAVLRIADHGIGIDPKFHERIFRIFERLHGYSRYPGSGVGLAIARRAIERMNGRIWVESEPGRGSCFCVELLRD